MTFLDDKCPNRTFSIESFLVTASLVSSLSHDVFAQLVLALIMFDAILLDGIILHGTSSFIVPLNGLLLTRTLARNHESLEPMV
jgi:hypothetical protein